MIDKINADIATVAKTEQIAGRFAKLGVDIATSTPEAFETLLKSDSARFTKMFVKADDKSPAK